MDPFGSLLSRGSQLSGLALCNKAFSELKDVAQSPVLPAVELLHETKRIRDLEQQFHLCRLRSDTPNWWLYDTDVSVIVERIAENLRLAQEQAFVKHVSQQAEVG